MRVVFVQSEFESLAIGIFSSLLKQKGHESFFVYDTRLFDAMEIQSKTLFKLFDVRDKLAEEAAYLKPGMVAFSVLTDQYLWAIDMARRVKKLLPQVPIIFGGPHVTMVPDLVIVNDCVDIICLGEGEGAFDELIENLASGKNNTSIKNLWFKEKGEIIKNSVRPLIDNLDKLPFPDKMLFYEKQPSITGHYGILSGRGCPFKCTYCASDAINRLSATGQKYVRHRSPQNVIDEFLYAQKTLNFKLKTVSFFDDTFTYDLEWLKEFTRLYKEKINLPFHCTGYPSTINYEKTTLLKDAGCYRIGIGVQSVSERIRKDVLCRPGSNEQIRQAAKACKDVGLSFWFDHILNIPYETEEEEYEALKFYNEVRPDIINVFWLIYYPRTKIIDIAKDAGMLDQTAIDKVNKGESSTAMVVGVGGSYSFAKERVFSNFAFLFHLLPLLSQRQMGWIIKKRMFMSPRFHPSIILNVIIKLLVRIKLGQTWDSMWFILITFKRMRENLVIKVFNRNIRLLRKKGL
ncbi:MAG TPA: hypothetical protein DCL49_14560 [Candidatus Omnitrophica bacterium]|nr:hypothetical protein [Candidatus Omnitrophota bacterium]